MICEQQRSVSSPSISCICRMYRCLLVKIKVIWTSRITYHHNYYIEHSFCKVFAYHVIRRPVEDNLNGKNIIAEVLR